MAAIKQKRPPKTIKEKKFAKEYIKTGNATEAAARVYDVKDRNSAKSIGGENLTKLDFADLMDEKGLTDEKLVGKLSELLEAQKTVSAVSGKDANAGTVDFVDVPDSPVQLKALEISLKLKDKFPTNRTDITSKGEKIESNTIVLTEFSDDTTRQ